MYNKFNKNEIVLEKLGKAKYRIKNELGKIFERHILKLRP